MTSRLTTAYALCLFVFFASTAIAQPGDRRLDMKARLLDALFPLDVTPKPYFLKMVLRFGDSDTQLVVVIYPGGKGKLIRYSLAGINDAQLSQMISRMVAENPAINEQEIATKLKVDVSQSPLDYEALNRTLNELRSIRISPVLANRVAVDESPEYEFWYDTWQESVHYTITVPFSDDPQEQLGKWMANFRANLPKLLKATSATEP